MIFLWIAFNAAYANDIPHRYRPREQELFFNFIERLCQLDSDNRLENLVWTEFPKSIRVLLNNKYVFQPFWDHLNNRISEETWMNKFLRAKSSASRALSSKNTAKVLAIILARVYTLRNQLIHGGSTWNSKINRDQLRDCANLMGHMVPIIISIMMDNPHVLWGQPCYPVVR